MVRSWYGSMRIVGFCTVVLAGAALGAESSTLPCEVFVSTNGNDANPGTETQPFASLDRARDYVRAHRAGATAPIQVCLRGGTYQIQHTFTLGPEDSGTATAPVTYTSYPGEHAIVSGGVQIHPNWSVYSGEIQVADMDRWFNQLFVNGVRATRARSPNGNASFNLAPVSEFALQTSSFVYQPGTVPPGLSNSDMEIISMERFVSPRQRVASSNTTTVTVEGTIYPDEISSEEQGYGSDYSRNDRYYIENSLAALDSPGEWYLDESAHKLYYWPRNPDEIRDGEFVVPRLRQLVRGGTYPANTGWQSLTTPFFTSCHHLGVYPQAPDSLSFGQDSFTVAAWLRFPSGTLDPFWVFSKGYPLGDTITSGGGPGYGLSTQSTTDTVPIQFFVNDGRTGFPRTSPPSLE